MGAVVVVDREVPGGPYIPIERLQFAFHDRAGIRPVPVAQQVGDREPLPRRLGRGPGHRDREPVPFGQFPGVLVQFDQHVDGGLYRVFRLIQLGTGEVLHHLVDPDDPYSVDQTREIDGNRTEFSGDRVPRPLQRERYPVMGNDLPHPPLFDHEDLGRDIHQLFQPGDQFLYIVPGLVGGPGTVQGDNLPRPH